MRAEHRIKALAASDPGLGKRRWVVERTPGWLHFFRRLRVRGERLPELKLAFLRLGCTVICQRFLAGV